MGPSAGKATAGATSSTATAPGGHPGQLLEKGGMGTWKPKVSQGLAAEELLSSPVRRTVRPSPRNESLCELAGVAQERRHDQRSPDSMRSVGCPKRGSREVAKGEAVTGGAAKGGAAVTLSAPAQRAVRPSFRNESICGLAGVAQERRYDHL